MPPSEWADLLSLIPGYDSISTASEGDYFDEEAAQFAIDFFAECLQFIEGSRAGQPFLLEPWQQAITAALWGWKRADGTRRYRECLIYVPRKNGKTPWMAGLMILEMFTSHEPGAQLYSAAASRDQSGLLFRHASGMIQAEPELAKRAKIYRSLKSIEYQQENAIFKALAADAGTQHGLGASFVVVDELHAHRDAELVQVLQTSMAARAQPLMLYITTADYDRPSICNTKYDYAVKVRDGQLDDPAFLPCIYEIAADDDWKDPNVWAKANPNLGVSVNYAYLARECQRAQQEPSYENVFKRLHLNLRTGQAERWLSVEDWQACEADAWPDLSAVPCYLGLDLSTTTDLTACVAVWQLDGLLYVKPHFWLPSAKITANKDKVPYDVWARQGWVTITEGNSIDYAKIRADINALAEQYRVQEVRADPFNATMLCGLLADEDGIPVTYVRQGYLSLNAPAKELERAIIAHQVQHDGNPCLAWQFGHVAIEMDSAGNIKPSKAKSTERIDGIAATINAISGILSGPQRSVYEDRGLIAV